MPTYIHEKLYRDWGQFFREYRTLEQFKSDNQEIHLIRTPSHGKVLLLNDIVQLTEFGHYSYHEMMVHVALFGHGRAKDVLIIGGGDGGVAREVLRHNSVESLVQVEIDQSVIDFSRLHFPDVSAGAFDDPRLEIIIDDGASFVANNEQLFDVIIVDSTDPIEGLSDVLFEADFRENCRYRLRSGGVYIIQGGVPRMQGEEMTEVMDTLREAGFAYYTPFMVDAPDYVGGQMALGWGTPATGNGMTTRDKLRQRIADSGFSEELQYYNADVHEAAFALPNYVRRLMP